jgi:hypothetical protein
VDWLHFIREVCMCYFMNNPIILGGEENIV